MLISVICCYGKASLSRASCFYQLILEELRDRGPFWRQSLLLNVPSPKNHHTSKHTRNEFRISYLFIISIPKGQLNKWSFIRMQILLFREILRVLSQWNCQFLMIKTETKDLSHSSFAYYKSFFFFFFRLTHLKNLRIRAYFHQCIKLLCPSISLSFCNISYAYEWKVL